MSHSQPHKPFANLWDSCKVLQKLKLIIITKLIINSSFVDLPAASSDPEDARGEQTMVLLVVIWGDTDPHCVEASENNNYYVAQHSYGCKCLI